MKGIILAGGKATRLRPLTWVISKQLLPVYNQPMIYYPIQTLIRAGITDILLIIAPENSGMFLNLLGTGEDFGAHFSYAVQKEPRGLADAFIIGADFIDHDNVTMILGDNIFDPSFIADVRKFHGGAQIYAKKVPDPQRYGVVEFDHNLKAISIEEKPQKPKSDYAVVGLYTYDSRVINYAKNLRPSTRNEIEITDLNNLYLQNNELHVSIIDSYWQDAGTFDSLLEAGNYMSSIR